MAAFDQQKGIISGEKEKQIMKYIKERPEDKVLLLIHPQPESVFKELHQLKVLVNSWEYVDSFEYFGTEKSSDNYGVVIELEADKLLYGEKKSEALFREAETDLMYILCRKVEQQYMEKVDFELDTPKIVLADRKFLAIKETFEKAHGFKMMSNIEKQILSFVEEIYL